MGRILQIRVAARTFSEEDVRKTWPRLVALAWPVEGGGPHGPAGVLELCAALEDGYRFAEWPAERKKTLGPRLERLGALKAQLEQALSDWQAKRADELSYAIEDLLDELEPLAPER